MFPKIKVDTKKDKGSGIQVNRNLTYKVDQTNLNVRATKAKLEIEWHSESSKKSKHLKNEFTNFVEGFITDTEIDNAIEVLNEKPESLINNHLDTVDINYDAKGNRLKDIIELYFQMNKPQEYYWFVKTDINTSLQNVLNRRGSFRVVMINRKDMVANKHYLQIIFVDPHHLFIPSKFKGKSAEQSKRESYREAVKLETCISKHLD